MDLRDLSNDDLVDGAAEAWANAAMTSADRAELADRLAETFADEIRRRLAEAGLIRVDEAWFEAADRLYVAKLREVALEQRNRAAGVMQRYSRGDRGVTETQYLTAQQEFEQACTALLTCDEEASDDQGAAPVVEENGATQGGA